MDTDPEEEAMQLITTIPANEKELDRLPTLELGEYRAAISEHIAGLERIRSRIDDISVDRARNYGVSHRCKRGDRIEV